MASSAARPGRHCAASRLRLVRPPMGLPPPTCWNVSGAGKDPFRDQSNPDQDICPEPLTDAANAPCMAYAPDRSRPDFPTILVLSTAVLSLLLGPTCQTDMR